MTRFWNNTKTALLMGALFGLILAAGYLLSGGGMMGLTIAFVIGVAMNFGAYFYSDKIALTAMRGRRIDAGEHEGTAPDLVEMVSRLARNANLPMPKVYICPQQAPNAFATGRNPEHAAVAVTEGALRLLDYDELEGVIGHELAHVKNRDTLISTVAATIAGALSYVGWIFMFGGGDDDANPIVMILFIIVAPIAAALIQMAISRSREFVADHDGATIVGSPHGLIAALQKLESMNGRVAMDHEIPSQNHMFIVQPLNPMGGMSKLFSTHPSTADRIAKLREMG